jgi:DNA/RNA endonuclease YhcR with UshA esterase domain
MLAACGGSPSGSKATPIAEARTLDNGTQVTVEGYVTVAPGAFSSAVGEGFALQDETGGIYVRLSQRLDFGVGTHVRVKGKLAEEVNRRLLDINEGSVEKLEGTRVFAPKDVSTGGVNESNEGLLVRASGNVTQTFSDDSPYGYKLFFNDGSGEVQIFIQVSTGFDPAALRAIQLGQHLEVTGHSTQYETLYEVAPRQPSDLVLK